MKYGKLYGLGIELDSYNLLKAYHIGAMEQNTSVEKITCDKDWENVAKFQIVCDEYKIISFGILKQLFNEQIYRSRIWSRNEPAFEFSKKKIKKFTDYCNECAITQSTSRA